MIHSRTGNMHVVFVILWQIAAAGHLNAQAICALIPGVPTRRTAQLIDYCYERQWIERLVETTRPRDHTTIYRLTNYGRAYLGGQEARTLLRDAQDHLIGLT